MTPVEGYWRHDGPEARLTPETFAEGCRQLEALAEAPSIPEYVRAPHHPACLAVRLQEAWPMEFSEPCPDPMGWWRFCTCATTFMLASYGYLTLRAEAVVRPLLDSLREAGG